MKKKSLIIIITVIIITIITGIITSYLDSARIRNSKEPKYVIKIINKDNNKVTYWGLGYKIIRYPSANPEEPYENNIGVKYGNWFMKYEINQQEGQYEVTKVKNVSINIHNISPTGATIVIKDTNLSNTTYGEWYQIEKEINGKWQKLTTIVNNYAWAEIAHTVDENNEVKFIMNWEELYGKLPIGTYRIVKRSHNRYVAVPFSITKNS